MRWVKNLINSIVKFLLGGKGFLFDKFGLSYDPSLQFSSLPSVMPIAGEYYELAKDTAAFEIIKTNIESNKVSIRETGTESIYEIDAELFIILFVKKQSDDFDFSKYR